MIPYQNRIKNQSKNNLQEHYAIISQPTTATSIPTEIMEGDEEKTSLRQAYQIVHLESRMAEDKKAEGQAETTCFAETMESKTVGFFT